jgi:FKBP-type peptidyl-prolyl cis-trans isomerase 2
MALEKKDFIEIEFTGMVKGGEIFDSNMKDDLKKLHQGHDHKIEARPFAFCLGEGMFLKGLEDFLIGKDLGKYEIELSPEKAFGNRDKSLVQTIPSRAFKDQRLNPMPGMVFNFDGRLAKVISVSGGRITVDFNNPLSGKTVVYKMNVLRKISDIDEKAKSLIEFLFKRDLKFEITGKKIVIESPKEMGRFIGLFKDKFKEILGLDLETKEIEEKKGERGKIPEAQ